jgi:hypothetical protein
MSVVDPSAQQDDAEPPTEDERWDEETELAWQLAQEESRDPEGTAISSDPDVDPGDVELEAESDPDWFDRLWAAND